MGAVISLLILVFLIMWLGLNLLPWLAKKYINFKMKDQNKQDKRKRKRKGKVYISSKPEKNNSLIDKEVGEYVDYEQVKDDK
ncbi:MAG: hypothetical protein WC140_07225 [Bacteroidales bacterium]